MKTFKILLIALAISLTSCSKDSTDDQECNCNKTTYDVESYIVIGTNGLPQTLFRTIVISNEPVVCQEEGRFDLQGNMYYVIDCD